MSKLLLIDNYDSFTHNLYHLFASLQQVEVHILRNDSLSLLPRVQNHEFDGIIIGPGPGSPEDKAYFGNCMQIIKVHGKNTPILGVCLGFQGIAYALGATLKKAASPMHGKLSPLSIHRPSRLLRGISGGASVMRYHSIMIDPESPIPDDLIITAEVNLSSHGMNGREIMAIEHTRLPLFGVQFHPESYADINGRLIAQNFINITSGQEHTPDQPGDGVLI